MVNALIQLDLELLKELVQLIDQQIEKVCELCSGVDDPDNRVNLKILGQPPINGWGQYTENS